MIQAYLQSLAKRALMFYLLKTGKLNVVNLDLENDPPPWYILDTLQKLGVDHSEVEKLLLAAGIDASKEQMEEIYFLMCSKNKHEVDKAWELFLELDPRTDTSS